MFYTFKNTGKPAVLLLHGFLGSSSQWDHLLPELEKTHSILTIDLWGHGKSPENPVAFTIADLAHHINIILTQENIEKLYLIGHSMGGYICSAFAKAYPEKTISLTLLNSIASADSQERKELRDRAIVMIERYQDAYVSMAISNLFTDQEREIHQVAIAKMKREAVEISIKTIVDSLKAMRDRPDLKNDLYKQPFPIIHIYGNNDTIIPSNVVVEESKQLNTRLIKIDAGHMILVTHRQDFLKKLHFIE